MIHHNLNLVVKKVLITHQVIDHHLKIIKEVNHQVLQVVLAQEKAVVPALQAAAPVQVVELC